MESFEITNKTTIINTREREREEKWRYWMRDFYFFLNDEKMRKLKLNDINILYWTDLKKNKIAINITILNLEGRKKDRFKRLSFK